MSDRPTEGFEGLRLSNTLTRQKDDFVPIDPANVRMYVCGPTVYDFAHIGNARPAVVFDVLFRLLRHLYGDSSVTYVRNITDVDDKINARAGREYPDLPLNEAIRKVTGTTERQYHEDVAALGCLPPTKEPRATEHMAGMIAMVEQLIARNNAYVADGHVLFDVRSWKAADGSLEYGRLANRSLEDMIAGARVEVAPYKRDPMDFVLWKPSTQGEPAWPSPWGEGRPGWHLECSVMAGEYLGDVFDIHGGGVDLVFPHHENEIAQSRCAHGTVTMANYWLHNGYLQVEGEKMSKSTGNFITIRDVLDDWPGEVVRLAMLKTHYRQPIDWTIAALKESAAVLESWGDATSGSDPGMFCADVTNALQEDLNTPKAIAALHELRKGASAGFDGARASLMAGANMLGLLTAPADDRALHRRGALQLDENVIAERLSARLAAREAKDFAEADRIRGELEALGIRLMDRKDPATGATTTDWEVK